MIAGVAQRYRLAGRRAFSGAIEQNHENIERALAEHGPLGSLLDLGCDDGVRTMRWARAAGAQAVHGIEVVPARATLARERGISVVTSDLGGPLLFEDQTFDAVVSNQVIEHLFNTDVYKAEALRCRLLPIVSPPRSPPLGPCCIHHGRRYTHLALRVFLYAPSR